MAMITAYMDETGHADDPAQHVIGMAGLINTVENWGEFDPRWKEALRKAKVPLFKDNTEPYFHMREFVHNNDTFRPWEGQVIRKEKLYGKLLRVIESTHAVPFGSIMPLSAWRALSPPQKKGFLGDPYFFCAAEAVRSILRLTLGRPPEETVKIIFSEKKKVKFSVRRIFDELRKEERVRERISDPIFEDMRKFPALQAADVVAYEMNLEQRRRIFRPDEKPRSEYLRLDKQMRRRVTGDHKVIMQYHPVTEVTEMGKFVEQEIARRKRSLIAYDV